MGYRTVVVLYNDHCSEWQKDPDLGMKISIGMNDAMSMSGPKPFSNADLHYGRVVQCAHADTQTLAILDGYDMTPLMHSFWRPQESYEAKEVRLLKEAAEKLGYKLVKKPKK